MYLMLTFLLCVASTGSADAQSSGTLRAYDLSGPPSQRIALPLELAEVSGLAFTSDGRLLAQADEAAVVYEIDPAHGRLVKRFGVGGASGPLLGDFEDMEVAGDRIFLVTSAGEVIEAREGADGETKPPVRRHRGLGRTCEVEGMTWDEASASLLLLCKQTSGKRWKGQVVIVAFSPETGRFEPEPRITVAESELGRATGSQRFSGSAIARHPRTGTFLMVAGPQRVFAEIDSTGKVLGGGKLSGERHRQPEGLAIAPDLTLFISDEAAGKTATITGYAYRR